MKAADLVNRGETAIVVFTSGMFLTIHADKSGQSGNWVISPQREVDKVIVYKREIFNDSIINEIFIGTFDEIIGPVAQTRNRYKIKFSNIRKVGTTNFNWYQFADTGSYPVRYITK